MSEPYTLITGGAGFIGTNLASRLASLGRRVVVLDNLSREGVGRNLRWLIEQYPNQIRFILGDVRDEQQIRTAVEGAESIFHLAAQVAVTSSLEDPVSDFEINARGTLNVLEAVRARKSRPFLLYTSTNKVLGGLDRIELRKTSRRYIPVNEQIRTHGLAESFGIEFCSPYGCSKGAADQYVLDYSRCYSIPATVLRMSCIYGPHQCGNEDQGWVAHFVRQILDGAPITLFGDGLQVRDTLYVEDLVDAFLAAEAQAGQISGHAFNMGGGPKRTTSLLELLELIGSLHGTKPRVIHEDWRPSDQRYYVSDTRSFENLTGWKAAVNVPEGVSALYQWMKSCAKS